MVHDNACLFQFSSCHATFRGWNLQSGGGTYKGGEKLAGVDGQDQSCHGEAESLKEVIYIHITTKIVLAYFCVFDHSV